jgi:SAM-dependent methyltransferase
MTPSLRELLALYHRERGGSLAETVEGVRELSEMFNGLRPHKPGYLAAGRLRRAYIHYYLPVNAEKVARVLAELETYRPPGKPLRVLDFGCGPGTASIAFLMRRKPAELALVDVVDEALDDARFFARALGVEPRVANEPSGTFDLILAANVCSETGPALEKHLADDGHLVVVEPALKERTRKLMEWRDRMAAQGLKVAAPCLDRSKCPMLERDDLWCHMDVPWPRPAGVAEVDRRLGFDKESLKYAYAVVTRTGPTLADRGGTHRLVSNLHREKGKAWGWFCGREGPLCRVECLTRHRGPETSAFFRASRGDVVAMGAVGESHRTAGPVRRESG